jgi:hypothetical protein
MNLNEIRNAYIAEGANYLDASSRTSQDVILALIAKSPLSGKVTIKGGVVIQRISGNTRRATRDFDFDFIKYPISGEAIEAFIRELDGYAENLSVTIIAPIEELKHQDYNGKRVHIRIADGEGTAIDTKLDIGVHKNINMKQTEYCFDLGKLDESVTLLVNTKEQIFAEKLKSLLRLGAVSTRYKDVFDMYYFATQGEIDNAKFAENLKAIVYNDSTMRENNISAVVSRLDNVLHDSRFMGGLRKSKRQNWIEVNPDVAVQGILDFMSRL